MHTPDAEAGQITRLLRATGAGNAGAMRDLVERVYRELRQLAEKHMANERVDHTLDPTALAHEAYLRLTGSVAAGRFEGAGHRRAVVAEELRFVRWGVLGYTSVGLKEAGRGCLEGTQEGGSMQTVVHVTHEAIQKIGGIGAVLQGMLTSSVFLAGVRRNVLVGPFWPGDEAGEKRLGASGEVLYSSVDGIARTPLGAKLAEIERRFDVRLVYGRRKFVDPDSGISSTPEVLLIDVARFDEQELADFKYHLWEKFGLDCGRYQDVWDFEQYLRLGPPTIAALHAIGACSAIDPCIILSHEYMGICTALAGIMDGPRGNFRTVFHAHECATMRRIVEQAPGHDTMFYNVMSTAMAHGRFVDEVFGDQHDFYRHALLKCVRFFDNVFAVGDYTAKEMRFLAADFLHVDTQVAYNGVPSFRLELAEKMRSRNLLRRYAKSLLKFEPDFVFTHVTRLVPSKAMWRDLRVLETLDEELTKRGETAVLLALSTEVPARRGEDIRRMEAAYGWPVAHREGGSDLSGGEATYYAGVQAFNSAARNVKVVFLNQFGFDQRTCGMRVPDGAEFMDMRKGSDAEFGQSIYEPFGIAQVEPISFGGICVYTNVCGCAGFVRHAAAGLGFKDGLAPNTIVADYTRLPERGLSLERLKAIGAAEREAIERVEAKRVGLELLARLPRTPEQQEALIRQGHELAERMSWDAVAREYLLPGFERAKGRKRFVAVV
jgi:hypothetical protein